MPGLKEANPARSAIPTNDMLRKPALVRYIRGTPMAEVDQPASRKDSSVSSAQVPATACQARRARGICSGRSRAASHQITDFQESSKTQVRQIPSPTQKARSWYSTRILEARLSHRRSLLLLPTRNPEILSHLSRTHLELRQLGLRYRLIIIHVL